MARARLISTALVVGVFVAACGGSATTAPGASSGTGPGTSEAPASVTPGSSQSGGGSGDVTAGAEINSSSTSTFGSEGTTSFTGVVVNKPDKAQQLDEVEKDPQGNVTSEFHFLIIGSQAWTKDTADGTY